MIKRKNKIIFTILFIIILIIILLSSKSYNTLNGELEYSLSTNENIFESEESVISGTENEIPKYCKLKVTELLQYPEFPTGCESVSLTSLLKYYGYENLTREEIIDNYLIYSEIESNGFVGDPRSEFGGGCFSNIITKVANNYLFDNNSTLIAKDVSGIDLDQMYSYLNNSTPILVWNTIDMVYPSIDKSDLNVGDYEMYRSEHCVVLYGYDLDRNVLFIMDPIVGFVERDIDKFYKIYNMVGKYAVIIDNNLL